MKVNVVKSEQTVSEFTQATVDGILHGEAFNELPVFRGDAIPISVMEVVQKAIQGGGSLRKLPQDHSKYFDLSKPHTIVPIESLRSTKDMRGSEPGRIGSFEAAHAHMCNALHGAGKPRKPITVTRTGDSFDIDDGNSTHAVAKHSGWDSMPVQIRGEHISKAFMAPAIPAQTMSQPARPKAPAVHEPLVRSEHAFTPHELSLPDKAQQPHGDLPRLIGEAKEHKSALDNAIDRGQGVGTKLGYHVVEGRHPNADDYEEAHKRGGMVVMPPLKGSGDNNGRINEKVNNKYGGDASKLTDISRASIAVSHPADIPHLMNHLREHGIAPASKPDNRFEHGTDAGYGDISLNPRINGHVGELQIHTLDHLQAKEIGFGHGPSGHAMYEQMRGMKPTASGELSEEDSHKYGELANSSKSLYSDATRRAQRRTPKLATLEKSYYHHKNKHRRGIMSSMDTLSPGHYNWGGQAARRRKTNNLPEVHNGKVWAYIKPKDAMAFDHEAKRITAAEAKKLVGGGKQNL